MAIVAFLALMLIIVYIVTAGQRSEVATQSSLTEGWNLCARIASEVNTAVGVGNGYERSFYLPLDVNGESYDVSVYAQEQAVTVEWSGFACRASVLTSQLTGVPHAGLNKVKNNGNVIEFS
jgi:hypothetical protein